MKWTTIDLALLEQNAGQIEGVPANPRKWTEEDVTNLANSIEETPELLEARGLLVVPNSGKYVILGGNMRHRALQRMGADVAPCVVMEGLSVEKMRQVVMKDNSSFGSWDMDELANCWDDAEFGRWGIKGFEEIVPREVDDYSGKNKEVDVDSMTETKVMKFRFSNEQLAFVEKELAKIAETKEKAILKIVGYEAL